MPCKQPPATKQRITVEVPRLFVPIVVQISEQITPAICFRGVPFRVFINIFVVHLGECPTLMISEH
jgi:hypothetical protein